MSKQDKPRLGEWVRFTHYHDRPTDDEVQARDAELDGADGTITLVRRENPKLDTKAVVVGICTVAYQAPVEYNDDAGLAYAWWHDPRRGRRCFYAVKRTLRGKRFLVTAEDLIRDGGDTP